MTDTVQSRQSRITGLMGVAFLFAVGLGDYQKSGLPVGDYLKQRGESIVSVVTQAEPAKVASVLSPR